MGKLFLQLDQRAVVARHGLTIGSAPACDVTLPPDGGVAPVHARVRQTGDGLWIVAEGDAALLDRDGASHPRLPLKEGCRFHIGPSAIDCTAEARPPADTGPDPVMAPTPEDGGAGLQPLYDQPLLRLALVGHRGSGKTSCLASLVLGQQPHPAGHSALRHEWLPHEPRRHDLTPAQLRDLKQDFSNGLRDLDEAAAAIRRGEPPPPTRDPKGRLRRLVFQSGSAGEGCHLVELIDYDGEWIDRFDRDHAAALRQFLEHADGLLVLVEVPADNTADSANGLSDQLRRLAHALSLVRHPRSPAPVALLLTKWDRRPPAIGGSHADAADPDKLAEWTGSADGAWLAPLLQQLHAMHPQLKTFAVAVPHGPAANGHKSTEPAAPNQPPPALDLRTPLAWLAGKAAARRRQQFDHRLNKIATAIDALKPAAGPPPWQYLHPKRLLALVAGRDDDNPSTSGAAGIEQALLVLRRRADADPETEDRIDQLLTTLRQHTGAIDRRRRQRVTIARTGVAAALAVMLLLAGMQARTADRPLQLADTLIESLPTDNREAFEAAVNELAGMDQATVISALGQRQTRLQTSLDQLVDQAGDPAGFTARHQQALHKAVLIEPHASLGQVRRGLEGAARSLEDHLLDGLLAAVTDPDTAAFRQHLQALRSLPPERIGDRLEDRLLDILPAALTDSDTATFRQLVQALGTLPQERLDDRVEQRLPDIEAALVELLNHHLQTTPPAFDHARSQLGGLASAANREPRIDNLAGAIEAAAATLGRAEADYKAYSAVQEAPSTGAARAYLDNTDIDRHMADPLREWVDGQSVQVQAEAALRADDGYLDKYDKARVVITREGVEVADFELTKEELRDSKTRGETAPFFVNPQQPTAMTATVTLTRTRLWWTNVVETYEGRLDYRWTSEPGAPGGRAEIPVAREDHDPAFNVVLHLTERSRPEPPPWTATLDRLR